MFSRNIFSISFLFLCSVLVQSQPMIWNTDSLAFAKSINSEAKKMIIRDADKELTKTITTVVDKPMTAASGDKHDYMSMGRYWWPNPNTNDGLPYVRKDGVSNPEIEKLDRIPLAQLNRNIKILSLAFAISNDVKYANKAIENIKLWFINPKTKMNPHLNYGQTIPGHNNGLGRGEGLIDTYSFIEILEGVELLRTRISKKDMQKLVQWFSDYLDWMLSSDIAKESSETKNNHGTAFDVQVVRYALFVGKFDVATANINDFAQKRLVKQIEPDGKQPFELVRTTAFGYSVFNLTHILDMCAMAKNQNVDLINWQSEDGRSIKKAFEFLIPYIGKHVTEFPYKQIRDWDKVQKELCWQLYRFDKMAIRSDFVNVYTNVITNDIRNSNHLIY